jgi:hypothetical protein
LAALPAVGMAAGGAFVDDDDSVFEADINWLSTSGVTAGCNPPTNDRFCPDDAVTRGQMAAFMRRFARFLGAEDGIVTEADTAGDANTLDGYDSSAFLSNDGYSVYNNGPIGITNGFNTVLTLPNLPAGSYLFIAKGWFINDGAGGSQYAQCALVAGSDWDDTVATVANPSDAIPATWTVVTTFTAASNSVELQCDDGTNQVLLNDAKITGIRLDSVTNQAG